MNTKLAALGLAGALALTGGIAAAATDETGEAAAAATTATAAAAETVAAADDGAITVMGVRLGNPFDPATWWDGAEESGRTDEMVQINPADPKFWMGFVDPERHSAMHRTFTNPATMAQFFKPETYTSMMDFGTWMSWMEVENYKPMFEAQTWAYWMQPGAYMHMIDMDAYAQMIDPANYEEVLNAALDTMGIQVN